MERKPTSRPVAFSTWTNDTETLGLWGSAHKQLWALAKDRNHIDEAVRACERGFYLCNDHYNGINFAFLLNVRAANTGDAAEAIADFVQAGRNTRHGPRDLVRFLGVNFSSNTPDLGKKASGQLNWQLTIAPRSKVTLWLAVAGTHVNKAEAYITLVLGLQNPEDRLADKINERLQVLAQSDARIPDPTIQAAFNWAKLNLADMRRKVLDAQIRDTMEGTIYPPPLAFFPFLSGFGAGYPDQHAITT